MLRVNEKYFIKTCVELLGENLQYIVNTDSYVRQPCYSARGTECYYLIIQDDKKNTLEKIKYIQGEFQEFILNYLTLSEIQTYPSQGKWQFVFSKILYNKTDLPILEASPEEHRKALQQALVGVGHIARHYYLREMDIKTHTWAVRQLGWALKYAEYGILRLWNYVESGSYTSNIHPYAEIKNELEWLLNANNNWAKLEKELLEKADNYKYASLKLSHIQEYFSKKLSNITNNDNYVVLKQNEYNDVGIVDITNFKNDLSTNFKENIRSLYLSGSAARGDQTKSSDIDTIIIFDELNDEVLIKLSNIIIKYEKFSAYTLSVADLKIYPEFRYYTLNEGTKKVFGDISFKEALKDITILDGILNNIFTILQVSRSYLLANNYGPRSIHMLKLMMKLADHGCMRPLAKYTTGFYPDKKDAVKSIYIDNIFASEVIDFVTDMDNNIKNIQESLLQGNQKPLTEAYLLLDHFAKEFREKQKIHN